MEDKIDGEKLIKYLEEKWGRGKHCSMCNESQWIISDKIFELREFKGGSLVLGGKTPIFPVIPAICGNCSNTLFINAINAGLLNIPKENNGK